MIADMINGRKGLGILLVGLGLAALLWLLFFWPFSRQTIPAKGIAFVPAAFADLPGWGRDDLSPALAAFVTSCQKKQTLPADRPISPMAIGGVVSDWRVVCDRAMALDESGASSGQAASFDRAIRDFFEQFFTPLSVRFDGSARGLFTGYYEPLIRASRTPDARYQVPIYRRPPELVTVDLGDFRDDLAGRRIAGKVENGRLQPFPSRHEIAQGALAGRGLELLWADDGVDVFFLQIQGSGRALLPDGSMIALGYDGPNGHGYTSLGRLMVERRILHPDHVSAPAIADWLRDNPVAGADLMAENASYIFFRRLDGPGPLGAEGVPLTPGRSLAVDRAYLPLGAPLWLAGGMPDRETAPDEAPKPLERLMVAQDTGGAIRGGVRGDVFWGFGDEAAYLAGHMAHYGRLWLLLPTPLAQRLFAPAEKS